MDAHETPLLFAPAYGSSALRTPFRAGIVNIRGSYFDEVRAIFSHLNERGVFPVCLLYEEHTIGDDVATQFLAMGGGVARTPIKDDDGNCLAHAHPSLYTRRAALTSTPTLHTVMYAATVKQFSMCGSIIVVLDEHTLVPIVKNAQSLPTSPLLVFTSFTESTHVLPQLRAVGCRSDNLVFSTVMPPCRHTEIRNLVRRYFPARDISFLAVEGYFSAQLFVAGLFPPPSFSPHTQHLAAHFSLSTHSAQGGTPLLPRECHPGVLPGRALQQAVLGRRDRARPVLASRPRPAAAVNQATGPGLQPRNAIRLPPFSSFMRATQTHTNCS